VSGIVLKAECGFENRVGSKFCGVCGLNLEDYRATHSRRLQQRIERATKLQQNGKLDEAIQCLAVVVREDHPDFAPTVWEATRLLGDMRKQQQLLTEADLHWQQGQRERAAELYREIEKLLPNVPFVRERLQHPSAGPESEAATAAQAGEPRPAPKAPRMIRLAYLLVVAAAVAAVLADSIRLTPARALAKRACQKRNQLVRLVKGSTPPAFQEPDWFALTTGTYRVSYAAPQIREWIFFRPQEKHSSLSLVEGEARFVKADSLAKVVRVRSDAPKALPVRRLPDGRILIRALKPGQFTVQAWAPSDRREVFQVNVEALPTLLAPVNVRATPGRGRVTLTWAADPKTQAKIVRFVVYRREEDEKQFTRLAEADTNMKYVDASCDPACEAEYRVTALAEPDPRLGAKGPRESPPSASVRVKPLAIFEFSLRGVVKGTDRYAMIVVRRWVDSRNAWASATFRVKEGDPIGSPAFVPELDARVDFRSGYRVQGIGEAPRTVVEERREPKYDEKGVRVRDESGKPVFVLRKVERKYRQARVLIRDARGRTVELWPQRPKPKPGT